MLGVDRFGAILWTFMGGVLLSLGWEHLTHYGRFGGPAAVAAIAVPLKEPQISNVGPARHGRTGHRGG
jgi:hypothetical protein